MSIQLKEANELRKRWKKLGNKSCDHTTREKEYHLGTVTGDYICTQCGEAFWEDKNIEDNKNH